MIHGHARRARPVIFAMIHLMGGMLSASIPLLAHAASLAITEIMYNPIGSNTGHQWVEVTNIGTDDIDLGAKDIRLFDSSGNHIIKAYGTGNTSLAAGATVVVAQNPLTFLNDYPNFKGQLLKSSFTLAASGMVGVAQVTKADTTILTKVPYDSAEGAKGDGNSLQPMRGSGGAFVAGAPTPGTYSITPPAPLAAPVKQISTTKSSTKSKKQIKTVTSKNHDKGTFAPADSANAASAGALPDFSFTIPRFSIPYMPLLASPWFVAFLALVGFSGFSLLVLQRQYR